MEKTVEYISKLKEINIRDLLKAKQLNYSHRSNYEDLNRPDYIMACDIIELALSKIEFDKFYMDKHC